PGSYNPDANGNNFLFKLLGAEDIRVVPGGTDMMGEMEQIAKDLIKEGSNPYIIPGGGSNNIGSTGYVACAKEILHQMISLKIDFDYIVTASGSGGTHSGLVAGLAGMNRNIPVLGMNVSRKNPEQENLIYDHTISTAKHVGVKGDIPRDLINCFDDY